MTEFIEGYEQMLEEYLEPYDPKKYGRHHTLLNETMYPLNPQIGWYAMMAHERMKFEKTRKTGKGVYNWWIHFNDFNWTNNYDMMGLVHD